MHREPYTTVPQWLPLQEAAERLSRYLSNITRLVLNDVLARGRVPVLAMRKDVVGPLPDRVEGLLAKASGINVASHNNAILAEYQFASEQDVRQLLGPRSTLADPAPQRFPLIINLDFDQVRVCWATLTRELRRVGWDPADEAAAIPRKLGLWPDSRGPIGADAKVEPKHPTEADAAQAAKGAQAMPPEPSDPPVPQPTAIRNPPIPNPKLVKWMKQIEAELKKDGEPIPDITRNLWPRARNAFPNHHVSRTAIKAAAKTAFGGPFPPGKRRW